MNSADACGPACFGAIIGALLLLLLSAASCWLYAMRRRRLRADLEAAAVRNSYRAGAFDRPANIRVDEKKHSTAHASETATPTSIELIDRLMLASVAVPKELPRVYVSVDGENNEDEAARLHRYGSDPNSCRLSWTNTDTRMNSLALSYPGVDGRRGSDYAAVVSLCSDAEDQRSAAYNASINNLLLTQYYATVPSPPAGPWSTNTVAVPSSIADVLGVRITRPVNPAEEGVRVTMTRGWREATVLHLLQPMPTPTAATTDNQMYYVDIRIHSRPSPSTTLALGLSTRPYPPSTLPGTASVAGASTTSIGLASDGTLHINSTPCMYSEPWGAPGDVIRVGYKPCEGWVGFWVNGKALGMAGWGVGVERDMYVCFGARGACEFEIAECGEKTLSSKAVVRP